MSGFASEEYNSCKTWIAAQIQAGATWEQVKNLCVSPEFIDRELERLKYDELIIPLKMDLNMWRDLVKDIEGSYSPIVEMYGISADGNSNTLPIPTDSGSAWVRYKNSLLGKYTRKPKMSEAAVAENIQKTEAFLKKLGTAKKSEISDSAYIWRNVPVNTILNEFLGNGKYHIFDCSSLSADIPVFLTWLKGMNADGHYLKWNVAVSGDSKAAEYWYVEDKNIGKITRTKKKTHTPGYIDIGSLRSGRDVLCDVQKSALTPGQKLILDTAIKTGKNLISVRGTIGLEDIPLLLLYRISKDQGKDTKTREKIGSTEDVIGFSIIVPGDSIGKSHVKSVRVKIPVQ